MSYSKVLLKPGKDSSLRRFHPWVFSGAIRKIEGAVKEGDVVEVFDAEGRYLATGHYQIGSITVRLFAFQQQEINDDFWRGKIERALQLRRSLGLLGKADTNICRLMHGEGDGMPGFILDYYGGVAVIQCHSIGYYYLRETLARLLKELMGNDLQAVYDKSASTLPAKAAIPRGDGYVLGSSAVWEGLEYGSRYRVDVEEGQKTGFFIDQRENRSLVQHYAAGKRVLNMFAYTGGFSIAALRGDASLVHSVDSSKKAVDLIEQNVALNFGEENRHLSLAEDAFTYFSQTEHHYDLVVLDPPAFAKHLDALKQALRGYRNLNEKALRHILPGGLLFTFSCSQVVSREQFREAVFSAAAATGRTVRILHQLTQPPDHPVNIYHPEGEYLKGLVVQVE